MPEIVILQIAGLVIEITAVEETFGARENLADEFLVRIGEQRAGDFERGFGDGLCARGVCRKRHGGGRPVGCV